MRRWFPEGWWTVAGFLVSVAIVSAPLWLGYALHGDFGGWAEEAAGWGTTGLLGLFGLAAVVLAVGKIVERAREARREAKAAGWGTLGRSVLRNVLKGVLRGAAVVMALVLAFGAFQEVARAFDRVDHWFWGWPADEGMVWDAVWVGGRLA
jgi:hypothetical protein